MRASTRSFFLPLLVFLLSGCLEAVAPRQNFPSNGTNQAPLTPILNLPTYPIDSLKGDLGNQLIKLEKFMPGSRSKDYHAPTEEERVVFAEILLLINDGSLKSAGKLAEKNGYKLLRYTDQEEDGAVSYLLLEQTPVKNGWGMFVVRESGNNNVIIEAPHPVSDRGSEWVAMDLYRALGARALLVAGAHRTASGGSADVANVAGSIFEAMHQALLYKAPNWGGKPLVLQVHGFSTAKHPEYPQVVLGYETGSSVVLETVVLELRSSLEARGISVGLCDGKLWRELCGTKNVQAASSKGAMFLHMEISEGLRAGDEVLISALREVLLGKGLLGGE
jgi:hypothetical protein